MTDGSNRSPRILVVDDDEALTLALSLRLRTAGFEVVTANSAESAARLVLHDRPSLIVLDMDLPSYSGLEFHECLGISNRSRNIPVIYLSGRDSPANRFVAIRQGGRAFITKPCNSQKLIETIHAILQPETTTTNGY